ncbi:MAG: extracellular solute-binding protein [Actinobacteria bacterium]|nr:extracellular solute-binding protein [Actinomycetota bacterium]
MRKMSRWLAGLATLAVVGAACGNDSDTVGGDGSSKPTVDVVSEIGPTEGELNLIAWNGYTEDGTNYPSYDWVSPFEDQSGCKVNVKYADTSDEMVTLMRQGGSYDGVSASGDATNRLIAGGNVAAVDPALFPDFANVIGPLNPEGGTNNSHYVVDGYVYGVPWMYGPNFLMYNADVVKPAPDSWDITFDPSSPYAGKVTAYDSPIFIADAAVYLKAHQPDLGIDDPYELTPEQLDAAVDLLKTQSGIVSKYWALYTDEIDGFVDGSMVAGTAWPINMTYAKADVNVAAVIPEEGVTGWADTWMLNKDAANPNCMLEWMKYSMQPEVQATTGIFYGAAGSNADSCDLIAKGLGKGGEDLIDSVEYSFCGNEDFLNSLYLWKTPQETDAEGNGGFTDYSVWSQKWTEVRGA